MNKMIPTELKKQIQFVAAFIGDQTNDWLKIKAQLIWSFPNYGRKLFSRRHFSTKKQLINNFDKEVMNYWEELTGIKPYISPEKLHPENWSQKGKGWALKELNVCKKKKTSS